MCVVGGRCGCVWWGVDVGVCAIRTCVHSINI